MDFSELRQSNPNAYKVVMKEICRQNKLGHEPSVFLLANGGAIRLWFNNQAWQLDDYPAAMTSYYCRAVAIMADIKRQHKARN